MTGAQPLIGTRRCLPPSNRSCRWATDCPPHLRGPWRAQAGKRVLIRLIQMIGELLWKPLASDFPGTKQCARNTSNEKSSERGRIPAKTSSRQKRFAKGTTKKSGHDELTRDVPITMYVFWPLRATDSNVSSRPSYRMLEAK